MCDGCSTGRPRATAVNPTTVDPATTTTAPSQPLGFRSPTDDAGCHVQVIVDSREVDLLAGTTGPRQREPIDLQRLLVERDDAQNLLLEAGDVLTLPVVEDKVFVVDEVAASRRWPRS